MNDINNYSSFAADSGSLDSNHSCLMVAVGSVGVEFAPSSSSSSSSSLTRCRKPRKKSAKLISIMEEEGVEGNKKRDSEEAPKITRPCTQCGKKFWSWKALYGHMRCHPERPWRGINPPRNLIPPPLVHEDTSGVTLEDHEVATCLLLLANSGRETVKNDEPNEVKIVECGDSYHYKEFECSSCKRVFGSHQALGGHRASHKNVKGCFAITRTTTEDHLLNINLLADADHGDGDGIASHQCSICLRVFPSGQALGGHKRCHWEKAEIDETDGSTSTLLPVDLNLPAPIDQHYYHCSSSTLTLDLRLGL
ncbi:hypothetical protein HN51_000655 [Arachis hypogaea]|uniref:Zinc finger protein ZAT3-like n=3 Tax=Arachis TaxID=3817 RepID=A0A6P5N7D2_ARADU|nr:zinc finger protein ZAT3-like [Arachis duranensis]XP_025620990.1 zinc finger protein ZAT3-like [Arachis hypogaea]XP_052117392.1 zinc finger protein ZAT3-like [Arachis duranensis]QHO48631.1 Zinc finger protein [Arachis hypogaea]RYR79291.1 hypothetical protein Ahy_A01g004123 [Arachis hypogaea]